MREFVAQVQGLPEQAKVLVHCESGLGRSAFMGAVYWITKGLSTIEAIARVRQAGVTAGWAWGEREVALRRYEKLLRGS